MAVGLFWKSFAISVLIITADARLPCSFVGELQQDLICRSDSKDHILKRGHVSDNNRTTGITLRGCRITGIDLESFNGLFGLKYLDISDNKIQRLKLGVLDGAKQVTYLNLSHNSISDLPLGLFDQKSNLELLDLKGNKINSLKLGIFDPLSKLGHLDLSGNVILGRKLNPFIFDKSRRIRYMDFSRNDMSGSPDNLLHAFQELNFLNLERCSLTVIPSFATIAKVKTMKHLMIATNSISSIEDPTTFNNLENLEKLNLAENFVEVLNENVLKPLRKLTMIILRNNKIKTLPITLFQNMASLINIDLSHNLIEFVPTDAFRGTKLKNLNLADNRFTYLGDNFCLELRNSGARLIKFFFNQNPWQCACLRDILNEVKTLGVEYNNAKYDGKEPVCATTKEFYCKRHQEFNELYVDIYYNIVNST